MNLIPGENACPVLKCARRLKEFSCEILSAVCRTCFHFIQQEMRPPVLADKVRGNFDAYAFKVNSSRQCATTCARRLKEFSCEILSAVCRTCFHFIQQEMRPPGIEPEFTDWQPVVLPLNYERLIVEEKRVI